MGTDEVVELGRLPEIQAYAIASLWRVNNVLLRFLGVLPGAFIVDCTDTQRCHYYCTEGGERNTVALSV